MCDPKATLPGGVPVLIPLSGIHNLKEGFSSPTLIEADGSKKNYTFTAIYKKSERANIIKVELANVRAQIVVWQTLLKRVKMVKLY
ncbi:hypothetical protein NXW97_24380 [Bacteroides faecis]|uniref:Uncharacterized protein n=1 Tax=Bacteroides faecis TaxID=674529 RepID=A0AAW5P2M1_9BACE|nr:hypothetical protein [Bacteroides faecis]MCS2795087.1 hypothetical protein [Bacteroides faecis]